MLDFCRYIPITLLSTIFLAGTANAQVSGGGGAPLVCSANSTSLPTLRSEGLTEAVGDIVIVCTGGFQLPPGQLSPQVNITVSLTSQVTSRLLNGSVSAALLLLDDPNSGLASPVPGYGPAEPFTFCGTPLPECAAWAQQVTGTDGNLYKVAVSGPAASAIPANAAPNVYQGVVMGNQVTFYGVPVLPPGTTGARFSYHEYSSRKSRTPGSGSGLDIDIKSLGHPDLESRTDRGILRTKPERHLFPKPVAACVSATLFHAGKRDRIDGRAGSEHPWHALQW
jgi:hypothetical protein